MEFRNNVTAWCGLRMQCTPLAPLLALVAWRLHVACCMLHAAVQPAPIASVRHVRFAHLPRFASPPVTHMHARTHPTLVPWVRPSLRGIRQCSNFGGALRTCAIARTTEWPTVPPRCTSRHAAHPRCSARQGPLAGRTMAVWLTPISIDPVDSRQGSRCRCRRAVGGERRAVCKYGVIHRGNHHAEHGSLTSTASRAVLPTLMRRWTTIAHACSHHVRLDSAEASLSGSGDERPRQLR